ncbi:MAG: thioredoxin family protein [Halopseudomonas aestusnigri]
MNEVRVVSRNEWLIERQELLEQEKQFTRARDRLSEYRRDLPWVQLEKDYIFDSEKGEQSLLGLFGDNSQLIVYHFMFDPDWEAGCVSCSFWADNFNGTDQHLNARDISMAVVARAPMSKLLPFKKRLGWTFNFVSSGSNTFNQDFEVNFGSDHKPEDKITYNYRTTTFPINDAPGISVFRKDNENVIYHTYSTYSRGLDNLNGAYHYIDLTPKGRNEDKEAGTMSWVRHHDNYS